VIGGSFFELVPSGGDAYVLKQIVRDWDESKGLEILRSVPMMIASICPNCSMTMPSY